MNISIVFFSDLAGTAYKAPRVSSVIDVLQSTHAKARFFGLATKPRNRGVPSKPFSALTWRFRSPVILERVFAELGRPFGRGNVGRLVANFALSHVAIFFGALRNCDVLYTQPSCSRLIYRARRRGIPVVVEHDLDCPSAHIESMKTRYRSLAISRRHWQSWNSNFYIRQIEAGIRAASVVIVFSQYAKDSLISCGIPAVSIRVYLPPPRDGCLPADHRDSEPTFVWASNHGVRKGIDILVDAWRTHKSRGGPGRLHVFGSDSKADSTYRAALRSLPDVVDHGSSDLVSFLANQRSIVVLPTVSEGFPRSVTEAMACGGTAILAADIANGVIDDGVNGWSCDVNVDSLSEKLWTAASSWDDFDAIGKRAAEHIHALTSDYAAKVFSELHTAVVRRDDDVP